jgi:hypothetical protein
MFALLEVSDLRDTIAAARAYYALAVSTIVFAIGGRTID